MSGIDVVQEAIDAAVSHKNKDAKIENNLTYICSSIEEHQHQLTEPYDAVVMSEVLEHVPSVERCLDICASCIRPGGSIFITSINKTPQSYLGAIIAAEYIIGLLPRGTHDWNMFVMPEEIKKYLQQSKSSYRYLSTVHIHLGRAEYSVLAC